MVCGMKLTYHETVDVLDVKDIAGSTNGCTLLPGIYEITDKTFDVKVFTTEPGKSKI